MGALAIGLLLFDGIADAADCEDSQAIACHACACGPHFASQKAAEIVVVLVPAPYAAYEPAPYAVLLPELIFHPPRLAA